MTYETNYLSHHGVKGMKWGVRKKYENIRDTSNRIHMKNREIRKKFVTTVAALGAAKGAITSAFSNTATNRALNIMGFDQELSTSSLGSDVVSGALAGAIRGSVAALLASGAVSLGTKLTSKYAQNKINEINESKRR